MIAVPPATAFFLLLSTTRTTTPNNSGMVAAYQSGAPRNGSSKLSSQTDDGVMAQYDAALKAASTAAAASVENFASPGISDTSPLESPIISSSVINEEEESVVDLGSFDLESPTASSVDAMLQEIESELAAVEHELQLRTPSATIFDVTNDTATFVEYILGTTVDWWQRHQVGETTREFLGQIGWTVLERTASSTKTAVTNAQNQWEQEDGNWHKLSQKALLTLHEQMEEAQADLKSWPTVFTQKVQHTIESEAFQSFPRRSFQAMQTFLTSDEVKRAQTKAAKAFKEVLESEELEAVKKRATKLFVEDTLPSKKKE